MDPRDFFKPYSPETHGDLREYLRTHDGTLACNLFHGPKYFFVIKDKGFLIPNVSAVRIDRSPAPDIGFSVNSDFLLESREQGKYNMSLVGAKKGVYDPKIVLRQRGWSILGLRID